jgi:DNA modification methylase
VGDIVLDPFCGGGTTAAICKMLDRRCISFEIDPQTADIARARVVNQQMPLKNSETTHQNLLSYEQSDE